MRASALVLALTALGAAIRVAVVQQGLFADELASWWVVTTHDFGGVLTTVDSDAEISPPLSFLLSWLATRVEESPEWLRAPSLVAGVLTIPGVYLIAVRSVGRAAGVVAAAFVAFAPFMVYYSAEARGYALMMAFVTLSTLALLAALDTRRTAWWVVYAAASCAAVYTHYTCVFVLGVQVAWVLWAHPGAWRAVLLANVAAAAVFAAWAPGLIADLESPTTDILSALQPFDAHNVRLSLQHWSVGFPYFNIVRVREVPGVVALALLAAAVVVVAVGLVRERSRLRFDRRAVLVFALALATPVGAALFSAVGSTNVFSARNLAASWPGLALSGGALVAMSGPRLRWVAAALAVGCFAIGAVKLLEERYERPHWEDVAEYVEREARPGDVIIDESAVLSPGPFGHIDPVLDAEGRRVLRSRAPQQREEPFDIFDTYVTPEQAARRAVAAADGARIFLVTDAGGAAIERPLGRYRLAESRAYEGIVDVVVNVYEEPAS